MEGPAAADPKASRKEARLKARLWLWLWLWLRVGLWLAGALLPALAGAARAESPILLFRLSADHGFVADTAGGDPVPNFQDKVRIVPDGAIGGAIHWDDDGIVT